MDFAVHHVIRHHMPDDRVVNVRFWDDGMIVCEYRFGYVTPLLVRELDTLSHGITESGVLQLDWALRDRSPQVMCWFETGDLAIPVRARVGEPDGYSLPMFFEIQIRPKDADPAIIRELNQVILPSVCGVLLPYGSAVSA
jgi:hypothetical protein